MQSGRTALFPTNTAQTDARTREPIPCFLGRNPRVWIGGAIDTLPEIIGLALHTGGHVGYYVGDGYAVEWRGFNYGCVRTKVKERKWKYWYKLPFIQYGEAAADVPAPEIALGSRLLKRGMVGSDVKALQELLMQLGYALPKYAQILSLVRKQKKRCRRSKRKPVWKRMASTAIRPTLR